MPNNIAKPEKCSICGCQFKSGKYAADNPAGRAHHSKHHYIAERFFGRTKNKRKHPRTKIFVTSPWEGVEGETTLLCYDCHEELLHNPVLLPKDIESLNMLVACEGLAEINKTNKEKIAGRIKLFHKVIRAGLKCLLKEQNI